MVLTMPGPPPLRRLYVYTTSACNCNCKHCWIMPAMEALPSRSGLRNHLSTDLFEAAVAEAKPLGLSVVKFTGGEPTVHPDLPGLLKVQQKYGLEGEMETNGMEVTPVLARLFAETGVRHVAVSLDGPCEETHDGIRRVRGGYRRTVLGIGNLTSAGFRPQIIMTLMRENAPEIEGLLRLAQQLGAGSVKFNILQPTLRGEDMIHNGEALSVPELIALNRRVEKELIGNFDFPIIFDIPLAFRSITRILLADGCSVCGIRTILGLLPDGAYALCGIGMNVPELRLGRVGGEALAHIWQENSVLESIRKGLPARLKGICSRCLMHSVCLGACIAQNYYRQGDLFAGHWFCEAAETESLFPGGRFLSGAPLS